MYIHAYTICNPLTSTVAISVQI